MARKTYTPEQIIVMSSAPPVRSLAMTCASAIILRLVATLVPGSSDSVVASTMRIAALSFAASLIARARALVEQGLRSLATTMRFMVPLPNVRGAGRPFRQVARLRFAERRGPQGPPREAKSPVWRESALGLGWEMLARSLFASVVRGRS